MLDARFRTCLSTRFKKTKSLSRGVILSRRPPGAPRPVVVATCFFLSRDRFPTALFSKRGRTCLLFHARRVRSIIINDVYNNAPVGPAEKRRVLNGPVRVTSVDPAADVRVVGLFYVFGFVRLRRNRRPPREVFSRRPVALF